MRLQISVQYLSIVNMLQGQAYLREPIQHVILAPILQLSTSSLLLLVLIFDAALQVATVSVVHHDTQLSFLGFVDFSKTNDIWVLKHFEDLCLSQRLPPFILIHILDIDLLNNCILFVRLAFYEVCRTERANTQGLDFLVGFILLLLLCWRIRWITLHFFLKVLLIIGMSPI